MSVLDKSFDSLMIKTMLKFGLFRSSSLFATAAFFGCLFFYYLKGRDYVQRYVSDVDWPEVPKVSMPKKMMGVPKMPNAVSSVNWPLSGAQVKGGLPNFLRKGKKDGERNGSSSGASGNKKTVSAPITVVSTTNEEATGPPNTVLGSPGTAATMAAVVAAMPRAPPRAKKNPPPAAPPQAARLATVASRPHNPPPTSAAVAR